MQLTQFTDYALRVLIYLALHKDRTCTITEISQQYGISKNHLVKIVHKLGQMGILNTIRGNRGGIQLSQAPSEFNIGHIVQKIEPHFNLVECFDQENGRCVISPACKLKHILWQASQTFLNTLQQYTLADITQNADELKPLFPHYNNAPP